MTFRCLFQRKRSLGSSKRVNVVNSRGGCQLALDHCNGAMLVFHQLQAIAALGPKLTF
jgi:hypothetical protein